MPDVRKIFLQTSVGEVLGLPGAGQVGFAGQAREILEAGGFQCVHRMAPQGHEAEELYLRTADGPVAMATLRYDLSAVSSENGQIVLTMPAGEERGLETRTLTLAEYVREKCAEGQKHTTSPINDRKPGP